MKKYIKKDIENLWFDLLFNTKKMENWKIVYMFDEVLKFSCNNGIVNKYLTEFSFSHGKKIERSLKLPEFFKYTYDKSGYIVASNSSRFDMSKLKKWKKYIIKFLIIEK